MLGRDNRSCITQMSIQCTVHGADIQLTYILPRLQRISDSDLILECMAQYELETIVVLHIAWISIGRRVVWDAPENLVWKIQCCQPFQSASLRSTQHRACGKTNLTGDTYGMIADFDTLVGTKLVCTMIVLND